MPLRNDAVSLALLFLPLLRRSAAQTDVAAVSPPPVFNLGEELNPTMAVVMVVLVSAFFSLGFFSVYVRHCARRRLLRGGAAAAPSWMTAALGGGAGVITALPPSFAYSPAPAKGSPAPECAVCLDEFEGGAAVRLLPRCGHVFHTGCVDAWLATRTTCPVCRSSLVPKPGEDRGNFIAVRVDEPVVIVTTGSGEAENNQNNNVESEPGRVFPRSNSTGHSLARFGEARDQVEPEDVQIQVLRRSRSLGGLVM